MLFMCCEIAVPFKIRYKYFFVKKRENVLRIWTKTVMVEKSGNIGEKLATEFSSKQKNNAASLFT